MKAIMASRHGEKISSRKSNLRIALRAEWIKMIHADSKSSIFRGGRRACNSKYASTFLFRSYGTSISATLNIHAILLTMFQTSLSPRTPFIFLDLCFRLPTFLHVARGARRVGGKNSLSRN